MGGTRDYLESGGFSQQKYTQIGTTPNGIKILGHNGASNTNTPARSNTPNTMYAKYNRKSNKIDQVSVYGGNAGREKIKDIDIEHAHENKIRINRKDKVIKKFNESDIHVHEYINGVRSPMARKPSKKERRLLMEARYGNEKNK